MEPIRFVGSSADALSRLKAALSKLPRIRIMTEQENYLHAQAESWLFGFVDDVEFLIDPQEHVIHFRSASRLGKSDLGVNRRRMEEFRRQFVAQSTAKP